MGDAGRRDELMEARVRVPERVVYRAFPEETVMLNHTAGRMLETLERSDSVADALAELTREYDAPEDEIERDLRELCSALIERELIELEERAP
jgi:hypothetical protein